MQVNYDNLMALKPTVYTTHINSLGQSIDLCEHPTRGDSAPVVAVCHDLGLAWLTDFYEPNDMLAEHREYEPLFINGSLRHGL